MSAAFEYASKHAVLTSEQLAAIPERMCQQCGWSPATRIKRTVKGHPRHICNRCFQKLHKPADRGGNVGVEAPLTAPRKDANGTD